jgi:hypothetical protein
LENTGHFFTVTSLREVQSRDRVTTLDATGAPIGFGNPDDSVDSSICSHSAFSKTYPADPISIATNGYLSLGRIRQVSEPSLPAQTWTRALRGTSPVPPRPIAAFWDDLYLEDTSSIYVDTLGTAQTANLLNGRMTSLRKWHRLKASLTFEAVLFEEATRQFLYQYSVAAISWIECSSWDEIPCAERNPECVLRPHRQRILLLIVTSLDTTRPPGRHHASINPGHGRRAGVEPYELWASWTSGNPETAFM